MQRNPYANPHTRYEVPVFRVPTRLVMVMALIAVGAIIGTIYLEATQGDLPTWRDLLPKHRVTILHDIDNAIQQSVDAHNPFLQAKGGR